MHVISNTFFTHSIHFFGSNFNQLQIRIEIINNSFILILTVIDVSASKTPLQVKILFSGNSTPRKKRKYKNIPDFSEEQKSSDNRVVFKVKK